MYKASIDLCRINKDLKIKFCLVIRGDGTKTTQLLSEFDIGGNHYLNINPYPYIVLDISNKKEKGWNPNQSCMLSGFGKYIFTKRLREFRKSLIMEQGLYFKHNGRLWINTEKANQLKRVIPVGKGKACQFVPILIEEEEGDQYEGICMMINSPDYFVNLTFEELEYLITYVERLDLENLSMSMLNTTLLRGMHHEITKMKKPYKKEDK